VDLRTFYILNLAVFTGNLGMGIVIPFLPIYAKTLGAGMVARARKSLETARWTYGHSIF
jgi:hypothetical protein